jgi:SAM-dependent methyltransferase
MNSHSDSRLLSWIAKGHRWLVFDRRVRVLAEMLSALLPENASALDIGCGDGTLGALIAASRPDVRLQGIEVKPRSGCRIPCREFDGTNLPFADGSFEVCMFVDVLHHTSDVKALLREAVRVSRSFILLKDHLRENALDGATLRMMDWVGNRPHGVRLTYNYQSREEWSEHFAACGLKEKSWSSEVPLYQAPVSWIAGRRLHLIALLGKW